MSSSSSCSTWESAGIGDGDALGSSFVELWSMTTDGGWTFSMASVVGELDLEDLLLLARELDFDEPELVFFDF